MIMGAYGLLGSLVSGAFDMGATAYNNTAATQREQLARRENYNLNEMAAENADKRTRALYSDLYSPKAQIQQLKEAGLSPSVYYDGGPAGMSGQAGAQGAGPSGISPNIFGLNPLTAAQMGNLLADTELKKEQAGEYRGENAMGAAKVNDFLASAGLKRAQEDYTKATTTMQVLENLKMEDTYNEQVQQVIAGASEAAWNAQAAYYDAERAGIALEFDNETFNSRAAEALNKANHAFWLAQVEERKVQLTEEQVKQCEEMTRKLGEDILQGWEQIATNKESVKNQLEYWRKSASTEARKVQNEIDKTYFEVTGDTRKEANRHQEAQDKIDLEEYKMILQAIAFYYGLQAKTPARKAPMRKAK